MELKKAVAVCLISLFSATLVVLLARSLDSQAASQLEPRLTEIAEELRAIRRQGGMARSEDAAAQESLADGLVVYYFHSDTRCPNCRTVEACTKELLDTTFARQMGRNEISWKTLNYTKPSGAVLAVKFEVRDPIVILAKMKNNEVSEWKALDRVLALAGDKQALTKYVREEIERMLSADKKPAASPDQKSASPAIPVPGPKARNSPEKKTPAIPTPK